MRIYRCPVCGTTEVTVMCLVPCRPIEGGVEVVGDIQRDGSDWAGCEQCEWVGKLKDLHLWPSS